MSNNPTTGSTATSEDRVKSEQNVISLGAPPMGSSGSVVLAVSTAPEQTTPTLIPTAPKTPDAPNTQGISTEQDAQDKARENEAKALLELIRNRNDHYRRLYFQHESRAQFLLGLIIVSVAALLPAISETPSGVSIWLYIVQIGAICSLLVSACLAVTVIAPLDGHRYPWLDDHLSKIGRAHLKEELKNFATPRPPSDIERFVRARFIRNTEHSIISLLPSVVGKSELYNLWAQWRVAERRAQLLRLTIVSLMIALLITGFAYIMTRRTIKAPMTRVQWAEAVIPPLTTQYIEILHALMKAKPAPALPEPSTAKPNSQGSAGSPAQSAPTDLSAQPTGPGSQTNPPPAAGSSPSTMQ